MANLNKVKDVFEFDKSGASASLTPAAKDLLEIANGPRAGGIRAQLRRELRGEGADERRDPPLTVKSPAEITKLNNVADKLVAAKIQEAVQANGTPKNDVEYLVRLREFNNREKLTPDNLHYVQEYVRDLPREFALAKKLGDFWREFDGVRGSSFALPACAVGLGVAMGVAVVGFTGALAFASAPLLPFVLAGVAIGGTLGYLGYRAIRALSNRVEKNRLDNLDLAATAAKGARFVEQIENGKTLKL